MKISTALSLSRSAQRKITNLQFDCYEINNTEERALFHNLNGKLIISTEKINDRGYTTTSKKGKQKELVMIKTQEIGASAFTSLVAKKSNHQFSRCFEYGFHTH